MSTVKDTDHGYKALVRRIYGFSAPRIEVGILESEGGEPHGNDAISIIEVAVFNEFGTEDITARSFIREWFDLNELKLRDELRVMMQSVVKGERTKEQILELMGQRCVASIQERMAAGIEPANAPSTIAKKGSSTPLIDKGILRSSVSYRVVEGGGHSE